MYNYSVSVKQYNKIFFKSQSFGIQTQKYLHVYVHVHEHSDVQLVWLSNMPVDF